MYSTSNIASTNLQMKISKFLLRVSAIELPIPGTTDLPLQQLPDTVFGVIRPRPFACHYAPPTCWSWAALHPRSVHRIHPNSTNVLSFCSFLNTQPNLPSSPNLRDHLPCASSTTYSPNPATFLVQACPNPIAPLASPSANLKPQTLKLPQHQTSNLRCTKM